MVFSGVDLTDLLWASFEQGEAVKKIYLDNCCFQRPYDDQSWLRIKLETLAKLRVQDLIVDKKFSLVTSFILLFEVNNGPHAESYSNVMRYIQANKEIHVSEANENIVNEKAREFMHKGLKNGDAQHLACALIAGCDYLLTTDDRFLKFNAKIDGITIINPMEFIRLEDIYE